MRFHTIERSRIRKRYHGAATLFVFSACVAATGVVLFLEERAADAASQGSATRVEPAYARRLAAYPKDVFISLNPVNGLYDDGPMWAIVFHIVGMSYMVRSPPAPLPAPPIYCTPTESPRFDAFSPPPQPPPRPPLVAL